MFSWYVFWASSLRAKQGWRRYATAAMYGFLAALAFPPFNAIPTLWICFPAMIFLLQGASKAREAFAVGWWFSFGLLVLSLYWIAGSMLVDFKAFWWAIPLSVAGLPAAFAFYYGLAAVAAWRWGLARADGVLFFALCWFFADYARGHLFTGFPWDITGYVWGQALSVLQITSVIGIHGLTLLTIFLAVLPAFLVPPVRGKYAVRGVVGFLIVFAAISAWGAWRVKQGGDEVVPDVRLRLVQSNVRQTNKWRSETREENFQRLVDTSFDHSGKPVTHIVWPETATAYYLAGDPLHRKTIAAHMAEGMSLLTGVVQAEKDDAGKIKYYNSLIAIDHRANVTAGYDKVHLVPFGEYMPFRSIIPVRAIAGMDSDFTPGQSLRSLRVEGLPPFSPLICYEAIFSGDVVDDLDRPQFLLNATNDAWYEHTIGPYQHFFISRVRAIEEGLPMVRVANKGVVAVIDSYGRIRAHMGWDTEGFIDSDLPRALENAPIFSRYRDLPVLGFAVLILGAILWMRGRRKVKDTLC